MVRKHIVVVDEEIPFPLTSGKRIRTYQLLVRLADEFRLTLLVHQQQEPAEQAMAEEAMAEAGIHVRVVNHRVPAKSGLGLYARVFANLFSPLPYSVATHATKAMARAIDEIAQQDPPDLWHAEWTPYARLLAKRPEPWVVMAHNVESLIWERSAAVERHPIKRWLLRDQWKKYTEFERWIYQKTTRAIAVSAADEQLMQTQFGAERTAVVDNGVDTAHYQPQIARDRDPFRLLFLGSLDWRPNIDGVRWMLEAVWPLVRQQEVRATFQVVGRKPTAELRELIARSPGVELHADVPDVRPFLDHAGMMVVPLRIGGGSRLKILEALATALPVVTTRVGVEGLRLKHQQHLLIADEPMAMADAIFDTMAYYPLACHRASHGRHVIAREYDWGQLAKKLATIWHECANQVPQEAPVEMLV